MFKKTRAARSRPVALRDIANYCGVSRATVCRALQNDKAHNKLTTERIHAAAKELGYDPASYQGARRLVLSRYGREVINHLIALFFPPFFYRSSYFNALFEGIWDVLTPEGFGLLTVKTNDAVLNALPPSFTRGDVDAVIIASQRKYFESVFSHLNSNHMLGTRPVIALLAEVPECMGVSADIGQGAYTATRHLLSLGHRHILTFNRLGDSTTPFGSHATQQVPGYRQAFIEAGLDPDTHLHFYTMDDAFLYLAFTAAESPESHIPTGLTWSTDHPLLAMLKHQPEITAILAPNDPTALLAHHLLKMAGLRVPEDISLVGFDDSAPLYDEQGYNTLTTVRLPLEAIGQQAARCAIDLATGATTSKKSIIFPTELIVRGSTAAPRSR